MDEIDKEKKHFRLHYKAFEWSEDVNRDFFDAYCTGDPTGYTILTRKMYERYELKKNRGNSESAAAVIFTKVIVNITLDDGHITSQNSTGVPYGATGSHVMELVRVLPGLNYIVYMDNWYSSIALAVALLARNIYMIGTIRKDRKVPEFIQFAGKHPKPTATNPKGTLKYAVNKLNTVFMYGFMDSSVSYIIDTAYGGSATSPMIRREGATARTLTVPTAIAMYNKYMGGVDQMDQMRNGIYGIEMKGRTLKWTVRFFECLLSFCLSNAYAIYRNQHGNEMDHGAFTFAVFNALFLNNVDTRSLRDPSYGATREECNHTMRCFPKGSRGANKGNRRRQLKCVNCVEYSGRFRTRKVTSYFCFDCKVPLHPTCFLPFHKKLEAEQRVIAASPNKVVVDYIQEVQ